MYTVCRLQTLGAENNPKLRLKILTQIRGGKIVVFSRVFNLGDNKFRIISLNHMFIYTATLISIIPFSVTLTRIKNVVEIQVNYICICACMYVCIYVCT